MMKPTRLATLYLIVVFLAGALFGVVVHTVYEQRSTRAAPNPKLFRQHYLAKLEKELSLSPEQVAQVAAILDQTGQRFREIKDRMDPEFQAIRDAQRARIMALLTPEQQPKYQKILEEHRRKHGETDKK